MSEESIQKKFMEEIIRHDLLCRGDHVLVAFSGGPDSTALLALLMEIKKDWALEISLAYFNHRLRAAAEEEEAHAFHTAERLGLRLTTGSRDVREAADRSGCGIEEAGRLLRYEFLHETRKKIGARRIATGHTLNDQAETVLIRLLRGSGPRGLSGIHPCLDGMIIRPLLEVSREEILAYLKKRGWKYFQDESNRDRRFFRNRVRRDLIPVLQQDYNPQILYHLNRIAELIREEDGLLESLAEEESRGIIRDESGQAVLNRKKLEDLPLALKRRIIRIFISRIKGDLKEVTFSDVDKLLALRPGSRLHLRKNIVFICSGDDVHLKPAPSAFYRCLWSGEIPLEIAEAGMTLSGEWLSPSEMPECPDDMREAYFDADGLSFPLEIRSRKSGDRYHPLGAPGSGRLKEIMRAKKIPLRERNRLPLVISENEIIWGVGLPVGHRFRVTPKTKQLFRITIESVGSKVPF